VPGLRGRGVQTAMLGDAIRERGDGARRSGLTHFSVIGRPAEGWIKLSGMWVRPLLAIGPVALHVNEPPCFDNTARERIQHLPFPPAIR